MAQSHELWAGAEMGREVALGVVLLVGTRSRGRYPGERSQGGPREGALETEEGEPWVG